MNDLSRCVLKEDVAAVSLSSVTYCVPVFFVGLQNLQREEASLLSSHPRDTAAGADDDDERDSIKEKVEFCRANAVGLTEELSHLKGLFDFV